jgi:hypothetical protein
MPRWLDIPIHLPSLATFAGLTLFVVGCAYIGIVQLRRSAFVVEIDENCIPPDQLRAG